MTWLKRLRAWVAQHLTHPERDIARARELYERRLASPEKSPEGVKPESRKSK